MANTFLGELLATEKGQLWLKYMNRLILPAIGATVRMVLATMFFAFIFGFCLAVCLTITRSDGLRPNRRVYRILDFLVNTFRSFPSIILIVAISPLTRIVMGTMIGERAAVFPLTIAATPFVARIIENAFASVDKQLIEAARSLGGSDLQIIFGVMLKEALPSVVSGCTLASITYLSTTTIAGAVGAGGIGSIALNYGYQNYNKAVLYTCVIILILLVNLIQALGNLLYKKL